MKQSEAVACRLRFKCPVNGCNIKQRWLSLCRHLVLFHDWRHSQTDKWRDGLTLDDAVGTENPSDRKRTSDSPRTKKQTPPPPKYSEVLDRVLDGLPRSRHHVFTLRDTAKIRRSS